MKFACLVVLGLCAFAQSASIDEINVAVADTAEQLTPAEQEVVSQLAKFENADGRSLFESMFEMVRKIIINGQGDIPVLDPFQMDGLGPVEFNGFGYRLRAGLSNIKMEGLRWLVMDHFNLNLIRMRIDTHFTLPRLDLTTNYEASARVAYVVRYRISGNIRIFLNRLEVDADMRLGLRIGGMALRELTIALDLHDTRVSFTGLTGSSTINNFIQKRVQNISQDYIQTNIGPLGDLLSEVLFDVVDDLIRNLL